MAQYPRGRKPGRRTPAGGGATSGSIWAGVLFGATLALAFGLAGPGGAARAADQAGGKPAPAATGQAGSKNDQPVYYQADRVNYDRDGATVTLEGHVEIWQGDQVLRADRVVYDQTTGVAAATGNVAVVEPDGQVVFAEYAELGAGMKNGVLADTRALLPQNGRLAANGARRSDGTINELSRAIYSTCNLCASDPSEAPLWDIRARSAVQDTENHKIEYRDAVIDLYGVPVAYFPFLAHPDPTQHRVSGILVPSAGDSSHLGAFVEVPYYVVIDDQSDATLTPILASKTGGGMEADYRRVFNNGKLTIDSSFGNATTGSSTSTSTNTGLGGHIFANGIFAIDDTWRWGFSLNRATSEDYLRDFHVHNGLVPFLTSTVWLEGFGEGSYTRFDVRAYQTIIQSSTSYNRLPYGLPRWEYSYFGTPDDLGGRFSLNTDAFNVMRNQGANVQRVHFAPDWQRPFDGWYGEQWNLTLHGEASAYNASDYNLAPDFGATRSVQSSQAMPTAALMVREPLIRDAGSWGTQRIEPIVQLIAAPNGSKYGYKQLADGTIVTTSQIPNEDSLDQELTDANLFSLNRFTGADRLEGGMRVNAGIEGAWDFPNRSEISGMVGESYRFHKSSPWWLGSGLENRASDIVSRLSYHPGRLVDLTTRARFDPNDHMKVNFADAIGSVGTDRLRISGGYLHSEINPFNAYDNPLVSLVPGYWGALGKETSSSTEAFYAPRDEVSEGVSSKFGAWKFSASARENLRSHQMDGISADGSYENECFIFRTVFYKRYTSVGGDHGETAVLLLVTLKTVGQFGYHAF